MIEQIKKIYQLNKEAGLLDIPYSDTREAEFTIEESLEDFDTSYLAKKLLIFEDATPKEISRAIVTGMCIVPENGIDPVKRLDKAIDKLVFTYGDLFKQGFAINQITRALDAVMNANLAKLQNKQMDEYGKLCKPANFMSPEPLLELIIKENSNG